MALTQVKTLGIAADAVTGAKVADDQINSEHYVAASIDHEHLANDCVDGDNIADDSIGAEHIADNAVGSSAIANEAVTFTKFENIEDGQILVGNGDNRPAERTISGDVTMTNQGAVTIANNAVTLAKMAGGTDGQIITYDASGDPVAVGPGTDGQVLTSTGAGSPPAFENAAGGGIDNAVVFRKTADTTGNCLPVTDWEKEDGSYLPGEIGSFSAPSSGVFTFPSTGYWYIIAVMTGINSGVSVSNTMWIQINVTIDNGGYWASNSICHGSAHVGGSTGATTTHLLDVTDLTNHKVKISLGAAYGGEVFKGDTNYNETHVTFIRLGDT